MRKCILGLICLILSTFTAAADEWDKAAVAYDTGRYQEAIQLMEPLAEGGLIRAQLALGQSYLLGKGVAVDAERAVYWYGLAADQYDPIALFNLAVLTMQGKGTKADRRRRSICSTRQPRSRNPMPSMSWAEYI